MPTADTERCEPCAARQAPVCTRAAMQPCRHGRVDHGPLSSCGRGVHLAYAWRNETAKARHYKHTASRSLVHSSHLSLTASRIIHSQTICIHRGLLCTGSHLYEASALTVGCHTSLCVHSHLRGKERKKEKEDHLDLVAVSPVVIDSASNI